MNALLESINGTSYKDKINFIGFPCNQFAHQEPAKNTTELKNGLKYVRPGDGYKPLFEIMNKTDVNGVKQNDVYKYLKVFYYKNIVPRYKVCKTTDIFQISRPTNWLCRKHTCRCTPIIYRLVPMKET